MGAYVVRRLLLIIPTLLGIMTINFMVVQLAPGGPVEQIIAQLTGDDVSATARITGDAGGEIGSADLDSAISGDAGQYKGARGLDPEFIKELEAQFGFDKPLHERYFKMLIDYAQFDFGTSFYRDVDVVDLVLDRLPVSLSLGGWTLLIVYSISIPLGILKAVKDGTKFDVWSSGVIFVGYAVPGFLFAILLIVLFAGGSFWNFFPLRGLYSEGFDAMTWYQQVGDYLWHITLPIAAMVIGGFATLTMLTKNSFLEEINKQFVLTARSKGLKERRVLMGHVFRNAMLIVIAGFPAAFVGILFTGSLLIEVIFSLEGIGLLGFEAAMQRDYPVMFGTLFCFTLLGLVMNLVGDLMYVAVDPRIDFETREV